MEFAYPLFLYYNRRSAGFVWKMHTAGKGCPLRRKRAFNGQENHQQLERWLV
jgi:hypothetical protein